MLVRILKRKKESQIQNQSQGQKQTAGEKLTENLSEKKSVNENQSQANGNKLNNKEGVHVGQNGDGKQIKKHSRKQTLY